MKLETRIFVCFVLTLMLMLLTGCHSTKWEWFPNKKQPSPNKHIPPLHPDTTEGITVIKGSF